MFKECYRQITPPFVQAKIKSLIAKKNGFFSGPYNSWEKANLKAKGYNDPSVLEKIKNATLQAKENPNIFVRDGVVFTTPQYSYPLIASLLKIATLNKGHLTVLDFGGGLGTSYYAFKHFCNHGINLNWWIIEQPTYVECGQHFFQDKELAFYKDVGELPGNVDIILLSGTLQYIEKPFVLLEGLFELKASHLLFDRTYFTQNTKDIIVVEHVPKHIYPSSYPCWLFQHSKMMVYLSHYYNLSFEFEALEGSFSMNGFNIASKGMFLEKK